MWRRFFASQEEEEEEKAEEIGRILEEVFDMRRVNPVAAPEIVEIRKQFAKEGFQNSQIPRVAQTSPQVIEQPNLQVPVGPEYMYRAQ